MIRLWQKDSLPSPYANCIAPLWAGRSSYPDQTEQVIAVAGYEGKIGIAFDEWNLRGWHHPDGNTHATIAARDRNDINATYKMADAVFSAGFLNTGLRHSDTIQMANMAPVVNTLVRSSSIRTGSSGALRSTSWPCTLPCLRTRSPTPLCSAIHLSTRVRRCLHSMASPPVILRCRVGGWRS